MNSIQPIPAFCTPTSAILVGATVQAGFPSPAEDFAVARFDLAKRLMPHPATTFVMPLRGDSMVGAGMFDGDWLVVDKVLRARHGSIVVAIVDGEFTCKRLYQKAGITKLCPENPAFPEICPKDGQTVEIWGVVTSSIRNHL